MFDVKHDTLIVNKEIFVFFYLQMFLQASNETQHFGHLMQRVDSLEKTDAGRDWGQEEKGMTEDEMAEWHH